MARRPVPADGSRRGQPAQHGARGRSTAGTAAAVDRHRRRAGPARRAPGRRRAPRHQAGQHHRRARTARARVIDFGLAARSRRGRGRRRSPARCSTARRSRPACSTARSTAGPTSTRWARCCTSARPGGRRSSATTSASCCGCTRPRRRPTPAYGAPRPAARGGGHHRAAAGQGSRRPVPEPGRADRRPAARCWPIRTPRSAPPAIRWARPTRAVTDAATYPLVGRRGRDVHSGRSVGAGPGRGRRRGPDRGPARRRQEPPRRRADRSPRDVRRAGPDRQERPGPVDPDGPAAGGDRAPPARPCWPCPNRAGREAVAGRGRGRRARRRAAAQPVARRWTRCCRRPSWPRTTGSSSSAPRSPSSCSPWPGPAVAPCCTSTTCSGSTTPPAGCSSTSRPRCRREPLLVVATARSDAGRRPRWPRAARGRLGGALEVDLRLAPLSADAVGELVSVGLRWADASTRRPPAGWPRAATATRSPCCSTSTPLWTPACSARPGAGGWSTPTSCAASTCRPAGANWSAAGWTAWPRREPLPARRGRGGRPPVHPGAGRRGRAAADVDQVRAVADDRRRPQPGRAPRRRRLRVPARPDPRGAGRPVRRGDPARRARADRRRARPPPPDRDAEDDLRAGPALPARRRRPQPGAGGAGLHRRPAGWPWPTRPRRRRWTSWPRPPTPRRPPGIELDAELPADGRRRRSTGPAGSATRRPPCGWPTTAATTRSNGPGSSA